MKALIATLCFSIACLITLTSAAEPIEADLNLFRIIKVKAESGDATAQFNLGKCYADGEGVAMDEVEAMKWYRKAAEQDIAEAQFNLGNCYLDGRGVAKDEVEAVKWFRKSAEQDVAKAQFNLGNCYAAGHGVAKDDAEAVKWFRKAAEQDVAKAQYNLGNRYHNGRGVAKDEVEAVKWFRKAAEQDIARAQLALGFCYAVGRGVAKDEDEAVKWYRKAAEQDEAIAKYHLGNCYAVGRGVAKDEVEAVKWYRKAAEQDIAEAQFRLGNCYLDGRGVAKDEVEAVKWYRKAAEQDVANAQVNLGVSYLDGEGVTKDEVEAVKWFRKATEQNNAAAQCNLGFCYAVGRGVAKDEAEAVKWFRKAAEQDNAKAKLFLNLYALEFKPRVTPSDLLAEGREASNKPLVPDCYGTGFFITEDGYLITSQHVVGEGATVLLRTSAGVISAKVIKADKVIDLAILKAEGKFAALPVITSRDVQLGATAATVGFPNPDLQGNAPKLAKGEIASLAGAQDDARHFQISTPIQPGNSGGALVDERGNAIGVVVAKLSQKAALATSGALAENVNYAVKSSYLLSFLESFPEVTAKLKKTQTRERKFEDVVKAVEQATVMVRVY